MKTKNELVKLKISFPLQRGILFILSCLLYGIYLYVYII